MRRSRITPRKWCVVFGRESKSSSFKLIVPMPLTYELLNTQFHDKVEAYKPLWFNKTIAYYNNVNNIYTVIINYYLISKQLHLEQHMNHSYVWYIAMIYSNSYHMKATYHNTIHTKNIKLVVNYSYELIPMPLR